MKKLFYCICCLLLTISCSDNDSIEDIKSLTESPQSQIRSYDEALQIAMESIGILNRHSNQTRDAKASRKIDLEDGVYYIVNHSTRTATGNDTLMYVFNFENNSGFSIVSANPATEGLLAVIESGHYDPSKREDDSGFYLFLDMAKEYVKRATRDHIIPNPDNPPINNHPHRLVYINTTDSINPLIDLNWGQRGIYGQYCPNGTAGCVNTAMAMIIAYFEQPTSLCLTYDNHDISSQLFDWDNIKQHKKGDLAENTSISHICAISNNDSIHNAIGRLMRQLGELNESNYDPISNKTGTQFSNAVATFQSLSYDTQHLHWSHEYVPGETHGISPNSIIMFGGVRYDHLGNPHGHAWIADGYKYSKTITYEEETINNGVTWNEVPGTRETTEILLDHLNWGHDGVNNGYFLDGVFAETDTTDYSHEVNYMAISPIE